MAEAEVPGPLTRAELERAALRYLERFDSSASNLRRLLLSKLTRHARKRAVAVSDGERALVQELVERYCSSGLIDDRRFALARARGLRDRGASTRAIQHKLLAKGVSAADVAQAVTDCDRDEPEAELAAARAFARRRRLGPYASEQTNERRRKDLAALARAGFSFDIARRALALGAADEEMF
jgi:regulatory protein